MKNISITDEILAQSMLTKWSDLYAAKWGIPDVEARLKTTPRMHPTYGKFLSHGHKGRLIAFTYKNKTDIQEISAMVYETFVKEQYQQLDIKNKEVIDIGSAIGDSAIYFALNEAKHIYAYEPSPYLFNRLKQNIAINGLENQITPINEAVGPKPGTIIMDNKTSTGGTVLKASKKGKRIKITTLNQIIKRFKIPKGSVLKMDIEGGEYDILKCPPTSTWKEIVLALENFDQVILEYHKGYKNIETVLNSTGFKTWHSRPRIAFYDKQLRLGLLYAKK